MQCICPKIFLLAVLFTIVACGGDSSDNSDSTPIADQPTTTLKVPAFNRDSAYSYVAKQVSFGPRVPGSENIQQCRDWMKSKLESYGAQVISQEFDAKFYHGETHRSYNIIGSFNPESKQRVILAAHYDTRFMAEEDSNPDRQDEPIAGADDGASGVGVLLEIARLLNDNPVDIGVDFILFDAEDQGKRGDGRGNTETWCLGSQYWSKSPHTAGYSAKFGILLDMVGAADAQFNKENTRGVYRNHTQVNEVYQKVWNLAAAMGKGRYFLDRTVGGIIDDHYFVNTITGIPMIDIINKPIDRDVGFGDHWHTHNDDMDIISKATLGSVGQVVTAVLYREASGKF